MKNRFFFLSIILLILISCDKKKDSQLPDNILFSNLNSPLMASTVRDWVSAPVGGTCHMDYPIPSDSSTFINLDIDSDSVNDFKITLSHNYWVPTQYCGHCNVYEYDIRITSINNTDSIALKSQTFETKYFKNSETISFENYWSPGAILIMDGGCTRPSFNIEEEYIGFKHNNQVGWIKIKKIPNNGISIENYGINLTEGNSINAGQTE